MSVIKGMGAGDQPSTGFFSETIDNSIRLVGNSSSANGARFTQTFSTVDSSTDFTLNFWVKRNERDNPVNSGYAQNIFNFRSGTSATVLNDIVFAGNTYTAGDQILITDTNSASPILATTNLLRDFSAWYNIHIMADMNNGTASERLKIFINGTEASYAVDNRSSYATLAGLAAGAWTIGDYYGTSYCIGSTIARWAFVDNSTLAATYFGEFNEGIWVPKALTGITWGSAGHLLDFAGTGTSQNSSGIGADTSGQTNHWAVTNIAATDRLPDTPTNNFATLNPLAEDDVNIKSGAVLSEGNLVTATAGFGSGTPWGGGQSTIAIPTDKKIYCEMLCSNATGSSWFGGVSIPELNSNSTGSTNTGQISAYNRSAMVNGVETDYGSSAGLGGLGVASLASGDILQIAVDGATGKVWFGRNGTYFKSPSTDDSGTTGDPAAGTNEIGTVTNTDGEPLFIVVGGGSSTVHVNFGADSSFAGEKTSGSANAADGEGIGDFYYTPPTGYVALCASNMSEPTIGPNSAEQADDYFNTVLYTGNGSTQSITGVGHQPDFVWIKSRPVARFNMLFDSVRGVTKALRSSLTNAEVTNANTLTSFDSDGFSLGPDSDVNTNAEAFVSWNWKAGGTAVSNTDGSITSSVSAAPDAGFSICTWTGNGTSGATIGHGLSSAPEFIIGKNRTDGGTTWAVYAEPAGNGYLELNSTAAYVNGSFGFNNTDPTSTVFTVDGSGLNTNAKNYIAYCFHSVEGYSKVGSFVGNANADGTFVYTGFRPAWIIRKDISNTNLGWDIVDTARSPSNVVDDVLYATYSSAEGVNVSTRNMDILSNGFKFRDAYAWNYATTYIYLAFSEAPFKFSNAR